MSTDPKPKFSEIGSRAIASHCQHTFTADVTLRDGRRIQIPLNSMDPQPDWYWSQVTHAVEKFLAENPPPNPKRHKLIWKADRIGPGWNAIAASFITLRVFQSVHGGRWQWAALGQTHQGSYESKDAAIEAVEEFVAKQAGQAMRNLMQ